MARPPTAPGIVKMKCMLWEPKPIVQRVLQDQAFVYNANTMKAFPKSITRNLNLFKGDPSGIYLREKYIYRDTFLKIGNETLNSARENMRDSVGDNLFSATGTPNRPYIYHQTFRLVGSLFSPNVVTPTGIMAGDVQALDNGLSKWTYEWADCPFNDGGNEVEEPAVPGGTTDHNFIQWRKNHYLMPFQLQVSTEQKIGDGVNNSSTTTSGTTTARVKPIHWLCLKEEPVYQGEDFWVEFRRRAYAPDIVGVDDPITNPYYQCLDARSGTVSVCGKNVPMNAGVVDMNPDGSIAEKSRLLFDFHKQPYYLIEIGHKHQHHNYFILLCYNTNPVFIHAGTFPIAIPGDDLFPPQVCPLASVAVTGVRFSRKLGTYDISCKELMDQDNLRVTVRNHLGRIVVTFSGHEDNPWVIERTDYRSGGQSSQNDPAQNDFPTEFKPMIVPEAPIQIGGGNMKVGFMFGPLHYEEASSFTIPQSVCVRGPVDDDELSLLLREKAVNKQNKPRFSQDAEIYFETIEGSEVATRRVTTLTATELQTMRAAGKNTTIADNDNAANSNGEWISYISVEKTGDLVTSDPAASGEPNPPTEYVKYFNAQYTLRAGDYAFAEHTNLQGEVVPKWHLWNTVTPIANGWRLFVEPNEQTHGMEAIDVAHHVKHFSASYSYTDNTKVDHTGNISFLLNFGAQNASGETDYSNYIASLNDKTFFLRVYAWWEGGYMDCDQSCPCKRGISTGTEGRVIFTGLCHGGEITIRGQERTMECQLLDYMKVLQDSQFLNSPFFDGMRDFNACYEVLRSVGFAEQTTSDDLWSPASLIKQLAESPSSRPVGVGPDGQPYSIPEYPLPSSFDILQAPFLRFGDGSKYDEAITKFAALGGKIAYFDRYGIFHLEQRPDIKWLTTPRALRKPKCEFYASPKDIPNQGCRIYDVLAIDQYTYKRGTADVVNEIHMLTATPDGEVVIGSAVNFAGKYDPNSPGYVGYTKRLLQVDGIFGSLQAVKSTVDYYKGFFTPPIIISWTSMGIGKLQAMDIVSFTGLRMDSSFPPPNNHGNSQPPKTVNVIITSLNMEIDPERNEWKNRYEGEWIFTGALPPTT